MHSCCKKNFISTFLAKHSGKEVGPGADKQSDDELNEYIRSKAETAYHPCGTCKMGIDDMAVVDENLKVKGIENLASLIQRSVVLHKISVNVGLNQRALFDDKKNPRPKTVLVFVK